MHYQPILNKYAYHRMLLCLPGKTQFQEFKKIILFADNNDVMTERDYSEELKS